jgi:hypothetical protein
MAPTVVVVAEYLAVLHHVRATLTPVGYHVVTSSDLQSGFALARIYRPSVFVMQASDSRIGLAEQTLRELRADPATAAMGVLLLGGAVPSNDTATLHKTALDSRALLSAVEELATRAAQLEAEHRATA